MRANLAWFLKEIIPVAEEVGMRMCIHPDDPPFSLYGLPRIVSTADDARFILNAVDSPANGLTLCTGSYGTRADNDIVAMVEEFGPRIHFAHLRNVTREDDGSFFEAEHLEGSTDMPSVILALMKEETRRRKEGRADWRIPMRPDHGHLLADDIGKKQDQSGLFAYRPPEGPRGTARNHARGGALRPRLTQPGEKVGRLLLTVCVCKNYLCR